MAAIPKLKSRTAGSFSSIKECLIVTSVITRLRCGRLQDVKALTNENDGRIDAVIIETYRMAKNSDKALQYSDQSLVQNPGNRQLQMVHADLVAEKGRLDEGIKSLQQLEKGTKEDLDVLSAMVSVYQRAKKFELAQTSEHGHPAFFRRRTGVLHARFALRKQKKYNDAEKAFRKALELQKDDPAVLNYLGYMLADRGMRLDEAASLVGKAVKSDPTNGAYLDSLGWVYFKQNKFDLARGISEESRYFRAFRFLNS